MVWGGQPKCEKFRTFFFNPPYRVAALHREGEPGDGGAPVQVVVGVAPAVAGQDAQHQVDAAAEASQDDMCGADGEPQLVTEEDNNDKLDDLDEKIEHVDENDTFLSLSVV